jgi:hypothetical protein
VAAEAKLPATLTVERVAVGQAGAVAAEAGAVVEEAEVAAAAEAEEEGEAAEGEAVAAEEVAAAEEAEVVGAWVEVEAAEAQLREQTSQSHRLRPRTATRQRAGLRPPPRISRRSEAALEAAIDC